jgi:CheY-like chemotaxis protein
MKIILVVEDDRAIRLLVSELMKSAGYAVDTARDGVEGLEKLKKKQYDLMLLDIWMPNMNGLEVLAELKKQPSPPKVIVMTADNTPETLLTAVRQQAYQYLAKPFRPQALEEMVSSVLSSKPDALPIEVISATPDWVELLVPCDMEVADRIQGFLEHLKSDLPAEVRETVGRAFHELLLNAIEWGGQLDPNRKVRIACLRARRMLLYRIADPGTGFRLDDLPHAAVNYPADQPFEHAKVREAKGLRAGGFGLLMTQAIVDELLYNEARNEVVFVKYLD